MVSSLPLSEPCLTAQRSQQASSTFGSALGTRSAIASNVYYVPLFKSLHSKKGGLSAYLTLEENGDQDRPQTGVGMRYLRPGKPGATFHPAGLYQSIQFAGSSYNRPSSASPRVMNFLNATSGAGNLWLYAAGADFPDGITVPLTLSTKNKITFASKTRKPTLKINPKTGVVTGSIIAGTKKRKMRGVVAYFANNIHLLGQLQGTSQNTFFNVIPSIPNP